VHFEKKLAPAMEFVFGSTACVDDIKKAEQISRAERARMVTLDGDLVEASGAVTGGFYKKNKGVSPDLNKYSEEKRKLEKEIDSMDIELTKMNNELEKLASKEQKTDTPKFERERSRLDEDLKKTREKRREASEKQLRVQQELGQLNIKKAKIESKFDNLKLQWKNYVLEVESRKEPAAAADKKAKKAEAKKESVKAVSKKEGKPEDVEARIVATLKPFVDHEVPTLNAEERETISRLNSLGPVNMKALQDFSSLKDEFDEFKGKIDKIVEEKNSIESTIAKIEEKKSTAFNATMSEVSKNFKTIYKELTGGDAVLELEVQNNVDSGLRISAQPPGKKLLNMDSMSGGEKTLTAFTFLFAIQRYKPAPFYMLDEADAALDAKNTKQVANLIKKQAGLAQFIIVSHNNSLVREADQIYGVTMEGGESKVMGIKIPTDSDTKNN
jgi:chromosome segregation protein